MSTFTNKTIIDQIIANDGYYPDDPRVVRIVEYTNGFGGQCWGVTWETESPDKQFRYDTPTQYVVNPKVIWTCI